MALWNGQDPILKERLFGLNPYEGNHGEDVKEYYYYLDATPTHSYMKFLYRYPHQRFPYEKLVQENQSRGTEQREFELIDTGIFADNAFFDVVVEYGKADREDTCIRIEIFNRGSKEATISVLPQLTFRNRWSWEEHWENVPEIHEGPYSSTFQTLYADPKNVLPPDWISEGYVFSPCYLVGDPADALLFTDNESHNERLYGTKSRAPYVKDAFHRHVIDQERSTNPEKKGTKGCFYYKDLSIPAGGSKVIRLRLCEQLVKKPLEEIDSVIALRKKEADGFYDSFQDKGLSVEQKQIQRQAFAGLLWSTQFYFYDVKQWLRRGISLLLRHPLLDTRSAICIGAICTRTTSL